MDHAAFTTTTLASSRWRRKSRSNAPPITAGCRERSPGYGERSHFDWRPSECSTSTRVGWPIRAKLLNLRRRHSQRSIVRDEASRRASAEQRAGDVSDARIRQALLLGPNLRNRRNRAAGLSQRIVHITQNFAGGKTPPAAETLRSLPVRLRLLPIRGRGRLQTVPACVPESGRLNHPSPQTRSPG